MGADRRGSLRCVESERSRSRPRHRSVHFLAKWPILSYEESAIQRFEDLRRQKVRIGRTDLRIAATVLEYGATLVTENVRDFKHVPGLKVVSWARPS